MSALRTATIRQFAAIEQAAVYLGDVAMATYAATRRAQLGDEASLFGDVEGLMNSLWGHGDNGKTRRP